ncbi:pseudouridine synthase [Gymnopilus junonius]|uniref:Pseudouridine synthase n=1 Tax=Gymnopilus junonius TaxID=109634 RepID=A0A9P5TQX5_GYMJU|nr:pseudouridine synthase [Gymnopilus junonius]
MSEVADPSSNSNKRAPDSLDEEIDNSAKRPRLISDEDKPMKTASTSAAEDLAMDGSQPTESNKHDSRKKSRGRGGRRSRNEEDASREVKLSEDGEPIPKAPRYPKRQCALLLGFCGSGYSGMQIQPDHTRTIEGVLFNALVKAGAVSQDNADNPTKVGLARAARTDAGVHAAGNLVSLKMIVTIPGIKDIVAKVNEELPPEIRLWGYVRTQNSFNARLVCDSRKYTYFFPTYLLIPPKPGSGFHRVWSEQAGNIADDKLPLSYEFWNGQDSGTKEEDLARKRAWRVSPGQIQTLRTLAARYEGTHNFHNFTVGREFADRSNNRYMKKIEISDPVVYGETEWISVLFHGQSFMLHQRKMMAILVLACRMGTPMRVISELYGQRDVFVPKMPSLGLLLEEPQFESYNERMVVINSKLQPTDPEFRPLIDFEQYRSQINEFKDEFIYKNMREVEDRDGLFDAWVRTIDTYAGNDLLYLNPTGAVPDAAVIVKGTRRENPFREKRVFDTTSFPAQGDADIKKKLEAAEEDVDEAEEVFDKRQLEETEG